MKPRFLATLTITALFGLSIGSMAAFPASPALHAGHPSQYAGTLTGDVIGVGCVSGSITIIIQNDGSYSGQATPNVKPLECGYFPPIDFSGMLSGGNITVSGSTTDEGLVFHWSMHVSLNRLPVFNCIQGTGLLSIPHLRQVNLILGGAAANPS